MLPFSLQVYVYVYAVLAPLHLITQLVLGHLDFRKQRSPKFKQLHEGHLPSVTVVVPVFNEDPGVLDQCLGSIYRQEYLDLEIVVVDDGSENLVAHEQTYRQYNHGRLRVIVDSLRAAFGRTRSSPSR